MSNNSEKIVYSEVYGFIKSIGEKYKNAIPDSIYKHISKNRNPNYNPKYSLTEKLSSQNLSKKATALIFFLHYKYWCETEEEKAKLIKILNYNKKN